MEREIPWMPIIGITGVLTLVFSIVAGIPQIVGFYPSILSGFLEAIPFGSVWGERVGLLLVGVTIGWYAHAQRVSETASAIDEIEGCVEVRGVAWKGTADLSNGTVSGIDVSHNPVCPKCQSPMNSEEVKGGQSGGIPGRRKNRAAMSGFNSSYFWKCPSSDCDYSSKKDFDGRDDALNLLEKHFDRITESYDEEYSLDALIDYIQDDGGEVNPRQIWRRYVQVVDDSDVSLKCFPE